MGPRRTDERDCKKGKIIRGVERAGEKNIDCTVQPQTAATDINTYSVTCVYETGHFNIYT